jgi:hypothetical protein
MNDARAIKADSVVVSFNRPTSARWAVLVGPCSPFPARGFTFISIG